MSREEAEAWIDARLDLIAVRAKIAGEWGSYFLSELPPELLAEHREALVQRKMRGIPVYALKMREVP